MSDAQQSLAITETVKPLVGEVVEIDNTNRGAKWKRCLNLTRSETRQLRDALSRILGDA